MQAHFRSMFKMLTALAVLAALLGSGLITAQAQATATDSPATLPHTSVPAVLITYVISGNAGVPGATLNYTGGSTTADGSGNYLFVVSAGWSGRVTPSKTGYTFKPTYRTYAPVYTNKYNHNFTANRTGPTPPTNLRASAISRTQINLSWNLSIDDVGSGSDHYDIRRSNGNSAGSVPAGRGFFSVTGLSCGKTYAFYVRFVRAGASSAPSNTASATTSACP